MLLIAICCLCVLFICSTGERLSEPERVAQWHRTQSWPPHWNEESDSYRQVMEKREKEIMQLTGADERWENWMQFIQGRMLPKFTEKGFDLVRTPPSVQAKLKAAVENGIRNWDKLPFEQGVGDSIYAFDSPKFVNLGALAWEVIEELKPLHEAWSGLKLRPTSAYGVRLYQNGSTIVMHYDKPQTHVISSIIHIAHQYDDDSEQWPIQIEDHDGNLHSVNLEEGQMLFYESAKCLHGRMKLLRGKYYGSIFVHYQPVEKDVWSYTIDDVINAVPPHWNEGVLENHGSRWAGQAITADSWVVDNAPPRVVGENVPPQNQYEGEDDVYVDFDSAEPVETQQLPDDEL